MRIEFYNISTGVVPSFDRDLFVADTGIVFENTYHGCESQAAYVSLYDFLEERKELAWRVIDE